MPDGYMEGNSRTARPMLMKDTFYLCLDIETLKYMGFSEKELDEAHKAGNGEGRLEVAVVYEKSRKWGGYVGVGKPGKH